MQNTIAGIVFLLLLTAGVQAAEDCTHLSGDQAQELRVKQTDRGYALKLRHRGQWAELLTSEVPITLPRLAVSRAELAFLLQQEGVWRLQLMKLDGTVGTLGELNQRPAEMCFDADEQRLLLVSASGAITPLDLPEDWD